MARSVWTGAISFGLVNVGVKAHKAVREHAVHFHQLDKNGARVKYKKVSEKTGREVEDLQLGYERSKGKFVTFDPNEIATLRPNATKMIEVSEFVDLADVDPVYFDTTYWLAPTDDAAKKAYGLLVAAMEGKQKVGIGSIVMRNKQHLCALRPLDGALAMTTMHWGDEVVPKSKVDGVPSRISKPSPKEMKLAEQIIDALDAEWDPKRYKDTYTEVLRDLIERKADGEEIEIDEPVETGADVLDLMAALEKSVAEAKKKPKRRTTKRSTRAKKSA